MSAPSPQRGRRRAEPHPPVRPGERGRRGAAPHPPVRTTQHGRRRAAVPPPPVAPAAVTRGRRRAGPPPRTSRSPVAPPSWRRPGAWRTPGLLRTARIVAGALSLVVIATAVGVVTFGGSQQSLAAGTLPSAALGQKAAENVPGDSGSAAQPLIAAPAPPEAPVTEPPVPVVPVSASGRLTAYDVPARTPKASGRTVTWGLEIEDGLPVDPAEVGVKVQDVLLAAKGWQKQDGISFRFVTKAQRQDGAKVGVLVTIASPALTDKLCAPLDTAGEVSCWNGERAVLNAKRWVTGAESYGTDVDTYRTYLVSHEVGHGLGHGHVDCPAKGGPALVMQQQSYGLDGCQAYPWPVRP